MTIRIYQVEVQENKIEYLPLKIVPWSKIINLSEIDIYRRRLEKKYGRRLKHEVKVTFRTTDARSKFPYSETA